MKILKPFVFAWNGIKICFISETNFKIHVLFTIIAIALGIGLHISILEWAAIIFCIALVLTIEMMNTALEKLCDVLQKEFHPTIKKVKDIAAGAVLVTAVCSLIIGIVIFLPKIISYIKSA